MPWGGASRRGGDNTSCIVTHVFSPPLLRAPSPLRPGTIRAAPSLSSSSTSSPRHAGIAGLSNIGQAPCTRPSGPLSYSATTPFCIAVVTDNRARGQDGDDESGVDLSPRDGDLLFLTVRRGSHRTRPGSSYFSHTLNARYSRLACHEGGPEVNCT